MYVDDFVYFSLDDEVEHYFEMALSQKLNVDFLGEAEWFLGMKFDWVHSSNGSIQCRISQEGNAAAIVDEMGLSQANKSPLMTPFHSGFPVDTIPLVDMSSEDCAPLTAKMQSWLGVINWLQMCTHPDLATIFSLLATHMHHPSPGHIESIKYVGCYILSTMDLGLHFTSMPNSFWNPTFILLFLLMIVSHRLPSTVSPMLSGAHRMRQSHHPLTVARSSLTRLSRFAVIFFSWGSPYSVENL